MVNLLDGSCIIIHSESCFEPPGELKSNIYSTLLHSRHSSIVFLPGGAEQAARSFFLSGSKSSTQHNLRKQGEPSWKLNLSHSMLCVSYYPVSFSAYPLFVLEEFSLESTVADLNDLRIGLI